MQLSENAIKVLERRYFAKDIDGTLLEMCIRDRPIGGSPYTACVSAVGAFHGRLSVCLLYTSRCV